MPTYSATDARARFVTICRDVAKNDDRAYIQDKTGKRYLTIDCRERFISGPIIHITSQYMKDEFSRFSSLIKFGMNFRLSIKSNKSSVIARRYQKYHYPLDNIISQWRDASISEAMKECNDKNFSEISDRLARSAAMFEDSMEGKLALLIKAIARTAAGYPPFSAGALTPTLDNDE